MISFIIYIICCLSMSLIFVHLDISMLHWEWWALLLIMTLMFVGGEIRGSNG